MGRKDSPPPTMMAASQTQQGSPQAPLSPVKKCKRSGSITSTISTASSISSASEKAGSPIRYVPRSKSAVNLHVGRRERPSVEKPPLSSSVSCSPVQTYVDSISPHNFKCALVGDSGVGKTTLLLGYTMEKYVSEYVPTIYDKFLTSLTVRGRRVSMTLCDTAGSDDFGHLRPLCYPQVDVAIICFSVVDHTSMENVRSKWAKEIQKYCPGVPIILVGTQVDKRENGTLLRDFKTSAKKYVSKNEGQRLASQIKASMYIECSAKTQFNVKAAFDEAIAAALEMESIRKKHTPQCAAGCTIL